MNAELYYENLNLALDRKELEEIIALWRESVYLGTFGMVTRAVITDHIPELAKHHNLEVTDEISFRELVELYYEKLYTSKCDLDPVECVERFVSLNEKELLKTAIKKAVIYIDTVDYLPWKYDDLRHKGRSTLHQIAGRALLSATEHGHLGIVKFLVKNYPLGPTSLGNALLNAINKGDIAMTRFLLKSGANGPNDSKGKTLEAAARTGNKDMIQLLIDFGYNQWEYGQRGASSRELRRFFSRKLAGLDAEL